MINKENFEKKALDFESSVSYIAQKSTKNAWIAAFVSMAVSLISVIAVCLLTPLKTVEPYVIKVDQSTGFVDIITKMDEKDISTNEAIDKHFIAQYVKAREGYYYEMLNKDYIFVQLLSAADVAGSYISIYEGDNARDKRLKNNYIVEPQIVSITLNESAGVKMANVRLIIKTIDKSRGSANLKNVVVTLAYDYYSSSIKESDRLDNPLGFKVIRYRIDEEIQR